MFEVTLGAPLGPVVGIDAPFLIAFDGLIGPLGFADAEAVGFDSTFFVALSIVFDGPLLGSGASLSLMWNRK